MKGHTKYMTGKNVKINCPGYNHTYFQQMEMLQISKKLPATLEQEKGNLGKRFCLTSH